MTDTSCGSEADLEVPQKHFVFNSQQAHHNLLVNECVAAEACPPGPDDAQRRLTLPQQPPGDVTAAMSIFCAVDQNHNKNESMNITQSRCCLRQVPRASDCLQLS